jgi:hypothetical protein
MAMLPRWHGNESAVFFSEKKEGDIVEGSGNEKDTGTTGTRNERKYENCSD